jgi:rod shape-determining protein MreC
MRPRTTSLLIVAGVIGVVIFFRLIGVFSPLEGLFRAALLPVARGVSAIGSAVGGAVRPNPDAPVLKARVAELEARLTSISVDYVRLRALEEENRSLQSLTGYLRQSGYDHVPARVIARSIDPRSATILIDRGSKDGVETGMAVIVGEGVFVGKVTALKERVSTVTLVSDEESRIAASLAGEHRLVGLIEGRGNHVARLTLVPQAEKLAVDDIIVTAGTEDKIPADLVIGSVNAIDGKPTDPFKSAALEPMVQSDSLNLVSVLLPTALRPEIGHPSP